MATVPSVVNSWQQTTDGTSFTDPSLIDWTPSTSLLEIVCVMVVDDGAGSPNPTVSGCGVTWNLLTDGTTPATNLDTGNRTRNKLFRRTAGTPTLGNLTVSTGGVTCERCRVVVVQFTETTQGDVVQVVVGSGTSTTPLGTLAAVSSVNNLLLGVFGTFGSGTSFTAGTNFTTLDTSLVEAAARFSLETGVNDTTVDGTYGASVPWTAIALEIRNISGVTGVGVTGRRLGSLPRFRRPAALGDSLG